MWGCLCRGTTNPQVNFIVSIWFVYASTNEKNSSDARKSTLTRYRQFACPSKQTKAKQSDCSVDCTSEPSSNQEQETRQCSQEPILCCSFQLPQSADNNKGDKNSAIFSPELIRPLPKALPRLIGHNKGRKRETAVLTDTPEKKLREMGREKSKQKVNKQKTD